MPLVNDFLIQCYFRPVALTACTIFETGDVKMSWASDVLTFTKGLFSATVPLVAVSGDRYLVQGRLNSDLGLDVFADGVKGTGNADVTDAVPAATLQIGSTELLTEHVNGNVTHLQMLNGDIDDTGVVGGPRIISATVEDAAPQDINIIFNTNIDGAPDPSAQWDVKINGGLAETISGSNIVGGVLSLTLSNTFLTGDTFTLDYDVSGNITRIDTGVKLQQIVGFIGVNNTL